MAAEHPPPRILTVQAVDWPRTTVVGLEPGPRGRARRAARLLREARAHDLVLLSGTVSLNQWYDQMLIAGRLARTGAARCVVLDGCYWEAGSRAFDRFSRGPRAVAHDAPAVRGAALARRLVAWVNHPAIHYVVYGSDERAVLADRWGIDPHRVHSLRYHAHVWTETAEACEPARPCVFAGGDSLRDYRALLAAAPGIDAQIVIATRLPLPSDLPANVQAGPLNQAAFEARAAAATVHVMSAIRHPPRSTGQASYLDALMLGIPVVCTEGLGVRDHLDDGGDALVVPAGDATALGGAINRLLRDVDLRRRLGRRGRERARREFTLDAFRRRQRAQLDELWSSIQRASA